MIYCTQVMICLLSLFAFGVYRSEGIPEARHQQSKRDNIRGLSTQSQTSQEVSKMIPERYLLSHHKTGTAIMVKLNRAYKKAFGPQIQLLQEDMTISRRSTKSPARIVHFVRNPFDMIVSSYLYHKQVPRPGMEILFNYLHVI